jgi:hypothetical protein
MTDLLKPYPQYKDSGVPWLGRVPKHWNVRRNGGLFAQRNETGFADLPILEVSLNTGVRVRDMDNAARKQVMSERDKYKRALRGDLAYNMMRMWQGALGVVPSDGLVSPAYVVARPFDRTDTGFFAYRIRLIADVVTGKVDVRHLAVAEAAIAPKLISPKANVHFRRSVFAAEIVHRLHDDPTFGHVKFEKTIFMCEKRCDVDTGSVYHRKAAGPYDNRSLRSIDSQMEKQKWYSVEKQDKRYRYVPMEKAGQHREYFDRYFGSVTERFNQIIDLFRPMKTQQCEIVATLYSAWADLLAAGAATDDQIIDQVLHHWHPAKQAIDEARWRRALGWMKRKGLTPE